MQATNVAAITVNDIARVAALLRWENAHDDVWYAQVRLGDILWRLKRHSSLESRNRGVYWTLRAEDGYEIVIPERRIGGRMSLDMAIGRANTLIAASGEV